MSLGQLFDFCRRERTEEFLGQLAQQRIAQSIDSLEVFEEQNKPLDVRRLEFPIDAVKRMGDGVSDIRGVEVALQGKDVVTNEDNVLVLVFANAPDQNMNLARVLREISGDLLTDERVGQVSNFQAAVDRVVISDGYKIHSAFAKLSMERTRIGVRVRKIKPPEEPLFGAGAEAGVNVKITLAHII